MLTSMNRSNGGKRLISFTLLALSLSVLLVLPILGLLGGLGITVFIWLRNKRKQDDSNE